MDCALWLNHKKIFTADEIKENLDIASLRGYLLAGTLIPWLVEHKGKRFVKRLAALKLDDPCLNEKIAAVFGGAAFETAPYKTLDGSTSDNDIFSAFGSTGSFAAALSSFNIGSAGSYNYGAVSSFGSYYGFLQAVTSGSFEFGKLLSSYNITSGGSFSYGWEWLWSFIQSYSGGSFAVTSGGSFSYGWEWLWSFIQSYSGGSFAVTSGGSFSYGWEWLWSFIQSYSGGSFAVTSGGSFSYGWEWLWSFIQSYLGGSFTLTSGGSFSYGWEWFRSFIQSRFGGSFTLTSGGSFTYGWEWLTELFGSGSFRGQFGSFDFGSFNNFNNKFNADNLPELRLDEYDLVLLKTLMDCPLDRFGYGIHNI